jgi:hypothetical protein
MKITHFFLCVLFTLCFISCDEIKDKISGSTNAEGLKEALRVGAENAVDLVGVTDGYFANEAIKIFLPDEAQQLINTIDSYSNNILVGALVSPLKNTANDVILSMNRAAEDAAKEAVPIFTKSITSMKISDAKSILFSNGNDYAATEYLQRTTSDELTDAYAPKINASLDKKLVGNSSTTQLWGTFSSSYNQVAGLLGKNKVNTDLGAYVTEKALDGLFTKVGEQEMLIRTDPTKRVNEILQSVFGQLDSK